MELAHAVVVHAQEALCRPLLGDLILQIPHSVLVGEFLMGCANLGQDTALKTTHVEEQVGVVFAVHRHKAVLPLHGRDGSRQTVLHLPEDGATQVHIVLHEAHTCITRPAFLVVVANDVLIVGIWVLREIPLDQITSVLCREPDGEK